MVHEQSTMTSLQLQQLVSIVADNKERTQRLERHIQRLLYTIFVLLTIVAASFYVMTLMPVAHAGEVVTHLERDAREVEHDVDRTVSATTHRVAQDVMKERAAFTSRMESIRADLNKADNIGEHAGATIAVLLHDIKAMLEAMPGMAQNMAVMTHDVNRMTFHVNRMDHKMGVITGGIDSTMGRMGRMMPGW